MDSAEYFSKIKDSITIRKLENVTRPSYEMLYDGEKDIEKLRTSLHSLTVQNEKHKASTISKVSKSTVFNDS